MYTLNNKLSINDATQSITANIITAKGLSILDTKVSGLNVTSNVTNNGQGGYASFYANTLNQSGGANETLQMFVGAGSGGNIVTRTQHGLKFSTYIDDPLGNILPSLQILSTTTRDVQINSPMVVKSSLSTFENSVFIGSAQLSSANVMTVVGGVTIGGKLRSNGIIEASQLKTIGSLATDGLQVSNIDGNMIAKFYNDYKTTLNGATTILGDLFCSHPIDAYKFTATEIRARDATGVSIQNNTGTTSIKVLDNSDVEIVGTLKIKSFLTTIDNGVLIGACVYSCETSS